MGAGRAGFAHALGAEHGAGRGRHQMRHLDIRHLARHRHEIVGEAAVPELARAVIEAFLE